MTTTVTLRLPVSAKALIRAAAEGEQKEMSAWGREVLTREAVRALAESTGLLVVRQPDPED